MTQKFADFKEVVKSELQKMTDMSENQADYSEDILMVDRAQNFDELWEGLGESFEEPEMYMLDWTKIYLEEL